MAKKTEEEIKEMCNLYNKLKNFSAVARELGVSASTVSKYVKLQQQEEEKIETIEKIEFNAEIKDIKDIPKPKDSDEWRKILEWAPEEWADCDELRKEVVA